jgi:hypothetical protein
MRLLCITSARLTCAWFGLAQTSTGTITGTVSDPAGAVVANALVEATNVGTNTVYRAANVGYRQLHHL